MRLPNLLDSRRGRIAAFFLLYLAEGIPQGFLMTTVATHLRRLDIGPAAIGTLIGVLTVPWAFKWAYGPMIDVIASRRFGHRRGWILLTQLMMTLTLVPLAFLSLPGQLAVFTGVLVVHNVFCAMQDVAVDGLACQSLHEDERAFASGMMFAGQYMGMLLGGSGALMLSTWLGFHAAIWAAALAILAVTALVVLPMDERAAPGAASRAASSWRAVGGHLKRFAVDAVRAFLGSRPAFGGLLFGLMPIAAMALSLSLQSNLAVELGMDDREIAWLGTWSSILTAASCVVGGLLSDRVDRRRALMVYVALMSLPGLYLMTQLQAHGWVFPRHGGAAASADLVRAFWIATLAYHVCNGFIYGARCAVFIDVTRPAIAATQFAAYMALTNVSISYSSIWQGLAVEHWGYPRTLLVDSLFGLASLAFLPMMRRVPPAGADAEAAAMRGRARGTALVLGLACLAWWPCLQYLPGLGGGGGHGIAPIAWLLFSLVFVIALLYLLAALALLRPPALRRWMQAAVLLLAAMLARRWLGMAAGSALDLAPLFAGAVLLAMAAQHWHDLHALPEEEPGALAAGIAPASPA